jgi:hypothetical protein
LYFLASLAASIASSHCVAVNVPVDVSGWALASTLEKSRQIGRQTSILAEI